jgi:hypothetical protein
MHNWTENAAHAFAAAISVAAAFGADPALVSAAAAALSAALACRPRKP